MAKKRPGLTEWMIDIFMTAHPRREIVEGLEPLRHTPVGYASAILVWPDRRPRR
jgi:hypothetical protein